MPQFADGVWLVELATLRDARLVPQAVASALGVKEAAGRPVSEALMQHVRDRQLLIILDNCEHLLQGCAELARQFLQAGRASKIIASSREALRLAGERTYAVPALPESEAERLFVDRALAAAPSFRTNGNAAAVASICRRLDGIPLAIELAAARVRTLPVEAIAARLDDRFRLLTSGDRTALPRQQTLRALIDWSYELLSEDERAVFRRLAVFAGGWTSEAAEAVCSFGSVGQAAVLDHVTQLGEKSLVAMDADRARYRLLETVREYAHERLADAGEREQARTRHLDYFLGFAETARPQLAGPQQGAWLERLDAERENLLAAHAWCDHGAPGAERGLKLTFLLRPYWINRGLLGLGLRLTVEALMRAGAEAPNLVRCSGLFDAGQLSYFMGRYAEAQGYLEESLSIARDLGDKRWVAAVLQPLGMAHLGRKDLPGARRYLEEAVTLAQQRGDQRELAAAVNTMAQLYRVEGDLGKAEALYEQVVQVADDLGDRETLAIMLLNLAMVAVAHRVPERARSLLLGALTIAEDIGSKALGQSLLEVCAGLAASSGDWAQAARFYGAAEAQAAQTGLHRDPADEAFLAPLAATARAAAGDAQFSVAEAAGRKLTYEAAIAEVRARLTPSG